MARIGVIGGGAFGTALSCVMRRSAHEVLLWARERAVVEAINTNATNPVFLPGTRLASGVRATGELARAADADLILLAPPAQHMREVLTALRPHYAGGTPVVTCSKGIERGSCALMSQVIAEALPGAPIAVLSGPSFAHDIAARCLKDSSISPGDFLLHRAVVDGHQVECDQEMVDGIQVYLDAVDEDMHPGDKMWVEMPLLEPLQSIDGVDVVGAVVVVAGAGADGAGADEVKAIGVGSALDVD